MNKEGMTRIRLRQFNNPIRSTVSSHTTPTSSKWKRKIRHCCALFILFLCGVVIGFLQHKFSPYILSSKSSSSSTSSERLNDNVKDEATLPRANIQQQQQENPYVSLTKSSSSSTLGSNDNTKEKTQQQQPVDVLHHTLLNIPRISAEYVWDQLILEASYQRQQQLKLNNADSSSNNNNKKAKNIGVIMEVGMQRATQCLQAAKAQLQAHCFEPSPKSFTKINMTVLQQDPIVQSYIHLYQMAASDTSNVVIPFAASGGTGDHVGEFDMWNMKPGQPVDPKLIKKRGEMIQVPTIRIDDIISTKLQNNETNVFLIKIDTQGYEPFVINGLSNSLATHKIQFLLMEYWPHGMDLITMGTTSSSSSSSSSSNIEQCIASTRVLQILLQNRYTIYILPPSTHPRAPLSAKQYMKQYTKHFTLDHVRNITTFCQWFYNIEELYPSSEYKMGYWADILAVAPTIRTKAIYTIPPRSDIVQEIIKHRNTKK